MTAADVDPEILERLDAVLAREVLGPRAVFTATCDDRRLLGYMDCEEFLQVFLSRFL